MLSNAKITFNNIETLQVAVVQADSEAKMAAEEEAVDLAVVMEAAASAAVTVEVAEAAVTAADADVNSKK